MTTLHPDSRALDQIGIPALRDRFDITRQAVHYWRRKGVPGEHRAAVIALGRKAGVDMADFRNTSSRRRGRPPTSGSSPASSASPA